MSGLITEGKIRAGDVREGAIIRLGLHHRLSANATGTTTDGQKAWRWGECLGSTSWHEVLEVLPRRLGKETPRHALVGSTASPDEQRQYLSPRYVLLKVSDYTVNDYGDQSMVVALENITLVDIQIEEGT